MKKVTNEVLAERIEHIVSKVESIDIGVKDLKDDVKKNTEFRYKARGAIGIVTTVSMLLGGLLTTILNKVWR